MQTLKPEDFIKVKRFIDRETKKYNAAAPMVKELSSVEVVIGECKVVKDGEVWTVRHGGETLLFNSKRNAMYYAFLVAFKNTKLIPELLSIDDKLSKTQDEIIRYKHLLNQPNIKSDNWKVGLYHNKLSEAVAKYQKAKNDMHNWMDYAKYIN